MYNIVLELQVKTLFFKTFFWQCVIWKNVDLFLPLKPIKALNYKVEFINREKVTVTLKVSKFG
jgi:hypothetical protein